MSNPTATWSWAQPTENADPWVTPFDTLISAIDTTVKSVAAGLPWNTAIMHVVPAAAAYSIVGTTGTGDFVVASVANFGRYVGSFTITHSGSAPLFTVQMQGQLGSGGGSGAFGREGQLFQRLVINPGSITVPNSSGNAWCLRPQYADARIQAAFSWVGSLGPGKYSAEVQFRLSTISAASVWQQQQTDQYILTLVEGRKGL